MIIDYMQLQYLKKLIGDLNCFISADYTNSEILDLKCTKSSSGGVIVCIDRNIFTDLISICKSGTLNNKENLKKIASFISFCIYGKFSIMPFDAIGENLLKSTDNFEANQELKEFNFIFDNIPSQVWLEMAMGNITNLASTFNSTTVKCMPFVFSNISCDNLMHEATMIHLVRLLRSSMTVEEKLIDFAMWYRKNCRILSYIYVYAILLLADAPGIKRPKKVQSPYVESVIGGCENQAFDFYYLSEYRKHCGNALRNNCTLVFATFDDGLQKIAHITHAVAKQRSFSNLLSSNAIERKCDKYLETFFDFINNFEKVTIIGAEKDYYKELIQAETTLLRETMGCI